MSNIELLGDRVLIQLDYHPEHTVTDKGIVVPHFVNVESDGGRPMARPSDRKYLSQGTIMGISKLAASRLQENSTPLKEGDRVYVSQSAVSPTFQFFTDRSKIVVEFDGHVCVPHTSIEAKILD